MLKKILIWLTKSFIILIMATLLFVSASADFNVLIGRAFSDIYDHSSQESRQQVISKLEGSCPSSPSDNVVTLSQICSNSSILLSMKDDCRDYYELKSTGAVESSYEIETKCSKIESGEIEKECAGLKNKNLNPDAMGIYNACADYKAGKINDREFFSDFIGSSVGAQHIGQPDTGALGKYNKALSYLSSNKMPSLIALMLLLALLYFLLGNPKSFILSIGGMAFSIGIFMLLPYAAIKAYDYFTGIDTTHILESIIGGQMLNPGAEDIIKITSLMVLSTYSTFVIATSILLLLIGLGIKVFGVIDKKRSQ